MQNTNPDAEAEQLIARFNRNRQRINQSNVSDDVNNLLRGYQLAENLIRVAKEHFKEFRVVREIVDSALPNNKTTIKDDDYKEAFRWASACYLLNHQIPTESSELSKRTKIKDTLSSKFYWGSSILKRNGPIAESTNWNAFCAFFRNLNLHISQHFFEDATYRQETLPELGKALRKSLLTTAKEEKLDLKLVILIKQYAAEGNASKKAELLKAIQDQCEYANFSMKGGDKKTALDWAKQLKKPEIVTILEQAQDAQNQAIQLASDSLVL